MTSIVSPANLLDRSHRQSVLDVLAQHRDKATIVESRPEEKVASIPDGVAVQAARAPFGMRPPSIDRWALTQAGAAEFAADIPVVAETIEDARARWDRNAEHLHVEDTRAVMFEKLTGYRARGSYDAQTAGAAIDAALKAATAPNPYAFAVSDAVFDSLLGSRADSKA